MASTVCATTGGVHPWHRWRHNKLNLAVAQTTEHQTNGQRSSEPSATRHFCITAQHTDYGIGRMSNKHRKRYPYRSRWPKFHAHKLCGA